MGDMTIGIALFVLIIVIGLAIGLRLSSTAPQRRAVLVAFASMAAIAVLFYVFAMNSSQLWVAPVFAIACIVVPIGAYTLMMRGAQPDKVVSRRSANEAPRPIHTDRGVHSGRPGSALDAAVMPMAPNHPVNECLSLQPDDVELAEDMDESSEVVGEANVASAGSDDGASESGAPAVDETAASPASSDAESGKTSAGEKPTPVGADAAGDGASDEDASRSVDTEAFIEEYLVEQNEDEGGLFEPEASPSLQTQQAAAPVTSTSTMMVTIPFSEGDERFLVVSESTSVPNPILAYKRTTSSHLVPMGSAKHAPREKTPLHADPTASAVPQENASPAAKPEQPVFEQTSLAWDEPRVAAKASSSEPAVAPTEAPAPVPAPREEAPVMSEPAASPVSSARPAAASAAAAAVAQAASAVDASAPAAPAAAEIPVETAVPGPSQAATATPAPESVAPEAPAAPAPTVEPAPEPAPAASVVVSEERFQEIMDKAQSLRERGMHPVAARLYAQAAETAPRGDAQRQARFEEIACYVKAGQNDKVRALAAQLRTSNVLTRIERIKLDAIERMG